MYPEICITCTFQKGPAKNALKESLVTVGFAFYLILARMHDIDPHLTDSK